LADTPTLFCKEGGPAGPGVFVKRVPPVAAGVFFRQEIGKAKKYQR